MESGSLKRQLLGTTGKIIYVVVAAMLPTFDLHVFMKLEFRNIALDRNRLNRITPNCHCLPQLASPLVMELSGGACRSFWSCPWALLCLCHRPLYIVRLSAETASVLEHFWHFFEHCKLQNPPSHGRMRCCLLAICLSASRREAISGGALVFTEADWNFITQFPFSSIARVPVFPKIETSWLESCDRQDTYMHWRSFLRVLVAHFDLFEAGL